MTGESIEDNYLITDKEVDELMVNIAIRIWERLSKAIYDRTGDSDYLYRVQDDDLKSQMILIIKEVLDE